MNSSIPEQAMTLEVEVAIVGGGPAGLMAAEFLSGCGHIVHLFDAMPSVGRKFLLAGRGGLNLTHSEPSEEFVMRYGESRQQIQPILKTWGVKDLCDWAHGLGIETFVGTSGRVFPKEMKAAPLLRAWLNRLRHPPSGSAVQFHMRHKLKAIRAVREDKHCHMAMTFQVHDLSKGDKRTQHVLAKAVILALGGGSWARLGSDGAWVPLLQSQGVPVNPLEPSNCGFHVSGRNGLGWTQFFETRFAGHPLKSVALIWSTPGGKLCRRQGEFVATTYGVEGSLIYAASADLREHIKLHGVAEFQLDLLPDRTLEQVAKEILHPRGSRSLSSHLKSRLGWRV